TTLAVVSGAFGAGFSATVALVLGFANLLADGFSMAVSNYEAIRARQEFAASVRKTEHEHIDKVPAGEREELRQIFRRKGFSGVVLESIVATLSSDKKLWVETMLTEEHGIARGALSPYRSGAMTFAAFVLVGSVPLVPLLIPALETQMQFLVSATLSALMFFLIGSLKSLVFARPMLRSGLYTLLTGSAAAGLAFLTGYVLRTVIGIDVA
ncbi:MAG: hypothetical protein RLZZ227_2949, partial [Pseudomonadota bacterium]